MNSKAIVLLSGGMDSATCLAIAIRDHGASNVFAVSFDYGQRHRDKELEAARRIVQHFSDPTTGWDAWYVLGWDIIDLESLTKYIGGSALTDPTIEVPEGHYTDESMKVTVVPNRNAIMLSICFGIAKAQGAHHVYAGMHAGDHAIYPDCRPEFLDVFQGAMDLAITGRHDVASDDPDVIELETPFVRLTKAEIVTIGTLLHVPYDLTWSCYKGLDLQCGKCGTCVERREAFELAGVHDPTSYAS